jgi:ankyrin repeat protein
MKHLLITTIAAVVLVVTGLAGPIHDAVMNGNIDEVQWQLDAGVDVNEESSKGLTPLHYAASAGHNDIVELLIERGANVNATDSGKGATPLDYAHWRDHEEVIETLNAHNAQREHEKGGKGIGQSSLIHDAALDGDIDEVQRQLDAGVDPNLKSSKGATPLFYAVYGGHLEIVELLITRGADVNALYLNGNSVLDQAHDYDDQEMVELLEAHGAEVADKVSGKGEGKGKSAFLSITILGDGDIIVEFDSGILQTANSINGPWEDVDEVSPVTWIADQFSKFARLKFSK